MHIFMDLVDVRRDCAIVPCNGCGRWYAFGYAVEGLFVSFARVVEALPSFSIVFLSLGLYLFFAPLRDAFAPRAEIIFHVLECNRYLLHGGKPFAGFV